MKARIFFFGTLLRGDTKKMIAEHKRSLRNVSSDLNIFYAGKSNS